MGRFFQVLCCEKDLGNVALKIQLGNVAQEIQLWMSYNVNISND